MNKKRILTILTIVILFALVMVGVVYAEDGIMFRRNVSHTPDQETERANLMQMTFYVPAQTSAGELTSIEYYDANDLLVDTRENAKPLIAVYIDGLLEDSEEEIVSILSGAGWGAHDAYAALSLDDGATWKRTNLSNSAELSSFVLKDGHQYPGDAHNMTFAIAGDKVLVGWISKYCDGGSPAYTWLDEEGNELYPDIWGVAGTQKSVDYTLQGFPEVGEVPYSCVWAARGQLLADPDTGLFDIVWTKAERLTSGRRDANRLEMNGDSAAGFMMVWQEDPEGLRPGQGLGPGEGWSGAVVNQQTDLWYSSISLDDFVMVQTSDEDVTPIDISEYTGETTPKVAVPMALPVRLTDNKMCKAENDFPYCYINFDNVDADGNLILPDDLPTAPTAESDLCASQVSWTNPGGTALNLCVAEDGRVLQGRVGASRPRVNVQPYDIDGDGVYDNAWVIMGAEESKALGEGSTEDDVDPEDIGKNMWYYTFDMLHPDVVQQGLMINQPAIDPTTGTFFDFLEDDWGNQFYETEIARRFSHFSQPIHQIGDSGVSAVLIVKQGIINQGGPADIFLRRIIYTPDYTYPEDLDGDGNLDVAEDLDGDGNLDVAEDIDGDGNLDVAEDIDGDGNLDVAEDINGNGILDEGEDIDGDDNLDVAEDLDGDSNLDVAEDIDGDGNLDVAEDIDGDGNLDVAEDIDGNGILTPELIFENPYAYENLDCNEWVYTDGSNPHYVEGLCLDNMINISGGTIVSCDNGSSGADCAAAFPWDGGESPFPKVTEWVQTEENLDDQSWENPYDVAKGHRGFIDGDFIMMMYAWSPNWKANSVGNDHYNLYARRSFDGGETWTTTPAALGGDGTTTCENYGAGADYTTACTTYGAGEFEQSRNLSQLTGNKVTILDPRYTPTGGIKMLPITDLKEIGFSGYDDDVRDPSKFFIVYETGDNTTVAEGEAVPLDLFYSRADNWGDDYDLVEYETGDGEIVEGFDWLEHDREDLSGEAANTANNAGTFYYVIWNQWQEDEYENVSESDAIFRRLLYFDDDDREAVASIAYVSDYFLDISQFDKVRFKGWARDYDHLGEGAQIVNYMWFDEKGAIRCSQDVDDKDEFTESCSLNKEGVCKCTDEIGVVWDPDMGLWKITSGPDFICDNDQTLIYECTNEAEVLAESLGSGRHTMNFRAMDNEGNWSRADSVDIFVFTELHQVFLPVAVP